VGGVSVRVGPADGENAEIGLIHEYGAPKAGIPARPFLSQTFSNRRAELVAIQAKIAEGIFTGKLDEQKAMALLGAWAVGAIKATITRDGHFVPLKPATIKRKGSDKPLIRLGPARRLDHVRGGGLMAFGSVFFPTGTYVVTRTARGTTTLGRYVAGGTSTLNCVADVQDVSGDQLEDLPEGVTSTTRGCCTPRRS
jgi:hypothetical protein